MDFLKSVFETCRFGSFKEDLQFLTKHQLVSESIQEEYLGEAKKKAEETKVNRKRKRTVEEVGRLRKKAKIHVKGENIPSPFQDFEELVDLYGVPSILIDNIKAIGFKSPTPIQMQAIPLLIEGNDVLGAAPTGSGKTAAFLIPMIAKLKTHVSTHVRSMIITPTRELSTQINIVFGDLSKGMDLRCAYVDRDYFNVKKAELDVVIGSPMTIINLTKRKKLNLDKLEYLILDEADQLLSGDWLKQTDQVLASCNNVGKLQKSFFSATLHDSIRSLVESFTHFPITVTVGQTGTTADTVEEKLTFVHSEEGKLYELKNVIEKGVKVPVLIFVQSKQRARQLFHVLKEEGYNVNAITSDLPIKMRHNLITSFRKGDIWFLICTDLMARGIDFQGVETVINYDFPQSTKAYIHRCGRTGRAGNSGSAITFWTGSDTKFIRSIANIMSASGNDVPEWMLQLKKMSKNKAKELLKKPIRRKNISSRNHDGGNGRRGGRQNDGDGKKAKQQPICFTFRDSGKCQYGDKCKFKHETQTN